jgi:hypothetical protein
MELRIIAHKRNHRREYMEIPEFRDVKSKLYKNEKYGTEDRKCREGELRGALICANATSRLRIGIVAVATFARTWETLWTQPTLWRAWLPQNQAVTQHLIFTNGEIKHSH